MRRAKKSSAGPEKFKLLEPGKEIAMTEERTNLSEGVILDELKVEEMEEVVAPAVVFIT